ncbi:NAD-dependent epimerase/dehydratase family protein [Halobellus litoreus]|uniref:NAD-dependent epimerase/dehydratase family protein n=1 Tax=Halobellus litoreus TaxID=755310 RepID=A0ABD6DUC9_9EURY|nr:GDP-mannose 4,6-dehydratase [Halobellus litoreus]
MSDRILVTGAAGFIGQHLVERLAEDGHEITAVDIDQQVPDSYSHHIGDNVDYIRGSIIHKNFVDSVLFPYPNAYERVFHLAAIVGVDRYIDVNDPLYVTNVNITGTRYLLEKIQNTDTHFIYPSTSEVYGKNPEVPWSEGDDRVLGPPETSRWSYSAMKAVCEHMIHMLGETDRSITTTVVRPFNVYGPYQRPKFVIPKFIEMVLNGEPPTVYGDGTQKRCFTYMGDFVEGLIAASERDPGTPRAYNLGGTTETKISDLAEMIIEIADVDMSPEYVNPEDVYDDEYDQPTKRIPDVSRARDILGWEADTSLEEGIRRTYEQAKKERES